MSTHTVTIRRQLNSCSATHVCVHACAWERVSVCVCLNAYLASHRIVRHERQTIAPDPRHKERTRGLMLSPRLIVELAYVSHALRSPPVCNAYVYIIINRSKVDWLLAQGSFVCHLPMRDNTHNARAHTTKRCAFELYAHSSRLHSHRECGAHEYLCTSAGTGKPRRDTAPTMFNNKRRCRKLVSSASLTTDSVCIHIHTE